MSRGMASGTRDDSRVSASLEKTRLSPRVPFIRTLACALVLSQLAWAQQPVVIGIEPVRTPAPILWRPYLPVKVPPARLSDSDRMTILIRAGKLYLTVRDAIALALENNIDIENARYNITLTAWNLERSQAGGALPGVASGSSQASSVQNGQGVLGSQAAAGVSLAGSRGGSNGSSSNATVSQVGPVTPTLDPTFQESTSFSHRSNPQAIGSLSGTSNLVQGLRAFSGSYQEGLVTGGQLTMNYNDHYVNENGALDVLNPSVAPGLSFSLQQNLLQGLGIKLNERNITVAKMNLEDSDLNFKTQVSGVVVNVLNTYYSLVADYEDVKAKQSALDTAGRFFDESKRRYDLGALAQLDVTTAENQVAVSQLALVNSQAALQQRQVQLKNLISRTGPSALIADVEIVPLDQLTIPATDEIPPVKDLVQQALANRSDLIVERGNAKSAEISALGTINGLLPSAGVNVTRSTAGLAGTPRTVTLFPGFPAFTSDPYFKGGIGTALGQIFRQNFPSEGVTMFGAIQIYDRAALADHAIDQLSLRQQQLITAKDMNQAHVDVTNSVVALRQARARYDAAVQSRILEQQLLDAEERRFNLGASTPYNVVVQQRDLTAAQSSELAARFAYQSARISLDQTTGATLEVNHISLADAERGKIPQPSTPPPQN